jgi:serine/threonine protein kinase
MSTEESPVTLGKYRVIKELGRGGMGVVYLARDTELNRDVALKCLAPALSTNPEFVSQFKREARAVAGLSDPRVVHIHNSGVFDGVLCIDMEYVEGVNLRDYVAGQKSTLKAAVCAVGEVLDGLAACHVEGIIHRDLKPSNILVRPDGEVRIVDFGLATAYATYLEATLTQDATASVFWGTARYAPPEAWEGARPMPDWDVYAVGALLYEVLMGVTPYDGATPLAIARAMSQGEPESLETLLPGISKELSGFVARCLSHDPAHRPADAVEAARLYERIPEYQQGVEDLPRISSRPMWRMRKLRRLRRRRPRERRLIALLSLSCLALLGSAGFAYRGWLWSRTAQEASPVVFPKAPSVTTVIADGRPTVNDLLAATRTSGEGLARGYAMASLDYPEMGTATWLHLPGDAGTSGDVVVLDERYLASLALANSAENGILGAGDWAGYGDLSGTRLRFGKASLKGRWAEDGTFTAVLTRVDARTGLELQETFQGTRISTAFTDMLFFTALERHAYAQPLIFLDTRGLKVPGIRRLESLLPAMPEMRLAVHDLRVGMAPVVDGVLDDAAWRGAVGLPGIPRNGEGMLRACMAGQALYLALEVPDVALETCVVRISMICDWGPTLGETRRYGLELRPQGKAAAWMNFADQQFAWDTRIEHAVDSSDGVLTAEMRWMAPAGRVNIERMNVQVISEGAADGINPVCYWGWPEFQATEQGVLVEGGDS